MPRDAMTLEQAEKLARTVQHRLGTATQPPKTKVLRLCKFILSGAYKREIKNAALERAAKLSEGKMTCGCGRQDCYTDRIPEGIAEEIRALIQPPSAQPTKHEDREG